MIGVEVTFRYEADFDPDLPRAVAEAARAQFEGMPGLRSKAFTIDEENRQAVNFYLWESEEAARAFFTDELRDRVTVLYGVAPTIQFLEIAALVDNT
jgi:heme-degrading monooxygenase HmoA